MSTSQSSGSSSRSPATLEHSECNICYEITSDPKQLFDEADPPVITKCGHFFGEKCLVRWLITNKDCPYCRTNLIPLSDRFEEIFDHEVFDVVMYSGRALRHHSIETQITVLRLVLATSKCSSWRRGNYEKRPCTAEELLKLFLKNVEIWSKNGPYPYRDQDITAFLQCALNGEKPITFEQRMRAFDLGWEEDDESIYEHSASGLGQASTIAQESDPHDQFFAITREELDHARSDDDYDAEDDSIAVSSSGSSSDSGGEASGRLEEATVPDEAAREVAEPRAHTNSLYYQRNAVAPQPAAHLPGRLQLPNFCLTWTSQGPGSLAIRRHF